MRVIKALKTLITYYFKIMPLFLVVLLMIHVIGNILPIIGMILFLPLKIGVAYAMLMAIRKPKKLEKMPFYVGLQKKTYIKDVFYMSIHKILYLIPALFGAAILGYINQFTQIELPLGITILNMLLFSIPSAILSLMLAMVPYLLADPKFNQNQENPLKKSAVMLKGHYIKLISMRLFFIPWFTWFASGFIVTLLSTYQITLGSGEPILPWLSLSWFFSLPIKILLIDPWYEMTHAQLYVALK